MRRRPLWNWALPLLVVAAPAEAQRFGSGGGTVGAEALTYRFGPNFGVRSLSQWALPVAIVVSRGRTMVDVGTYLASTSLERRDGTSLRVTGFTDTQVRGAYVVGQDAVVLTAVVNLPTGASELTLAEYAVLASASSSFLAFPVNAYGSGASLTAGAAAALPAGAWNLGLAGSIRLSDDFTPFRDADGGFTYRAGLETRLRAGADRLVGPARLSLGLTFSTFSNDEFANGSGVTGVYRPGTRFIVEASYATAVGATSVIAYAWDFLRLAGDSAGTDTKNRENVLAGGARLIVPLGRRVFFEPGLEGRATWPEEGQGALLQFTSALRLRLTRRLTILPALRLNLGRLEEPPPGIGHQIWAYGLSVFIRESF